MSYIITFDVEAERRTGLVQAIKTTGDWGEVTPTSYLVASPQTVRSIIETLQPMLGPQDSLAVVTVSAPWAAYCDSNAETLAVSLLGKDETWIPKDWNGTDRS